MLFNSLHFVIFFPIVVAFYFSIPQRYRWALLLVASYYFYMAWKPGYALLIVTSTLIDYVASQMIGKAGSKAARQPADELRTAVHFQVLQFPQRVAAGNFIAVPASVCPAPIRLASASRHFVLHLPDS